MSQQPTPAESSWSREQIEELLEKETFRYQSIPLPYGIRTDGHDRSSTADAIYPRDMSGQSVMDVGCGLGFFCFDAAKRGATRVLGVDLEIENVRKARLLNQAQGLDVEFSYRDLEHDPVDERFDNVLCLNVLHHLVDPIHSLDRLIAYTRKRLILEVATLGKHDRRMLGINKIEQMMLEKMPVMMIGTGGVTAGIKQFYFTQTAIENLLRYRRGCFARVEMIPSEFKGRFIVVGHVHDIRKELVVGAPHPSLAAELRSRFRSGAMEMLGDRLGLGSGENWHDHFAAEDFHLDRPPVQERLIFEYDFLRPFATGSMTFAHDPAVEVMSAADETRVVTAWVSPELLTGRLRQAHEAATGREKKRLSRTLDECSRTDRLLSHYRAWFEYAARFGTDQAVAVLDDETRILSIDEWETEIAARLV